MCGGRVQGWVEDGKKNNNKQMFFKITFKKTPFTRIQKVVFFIL